MGFPHRPLFQRNFRLAAAAVVPAVMLLTAASQPAVAEDAYYHLRLDDLEIVEGELPKSSDRTNFRNWRLRRMLTPRVELNGEGEAYAGASIAAQERRRVDVDVRNPNAPRTEAADENSIVLRVPKSRDAKNATVNGTLYMSNGEKMVPFRFTVPASKAGGEEARKQFLLVKESHYRRLTQANIPGGAWFRYQRWETRAERTGKSEDDVIADLNRQVREQQRRDRPTDYEDTYQILSGGRAVSENLQLDRMMRATKPDDPSVDVASLKGVTIKEMDWDKLLKDQKTPTDALANLVPHDQHAVFLPDFKSLVTITDEAKRNGTVLLDAFQGRSENALTQERYERQLCLGLDAVTRALGGQVVKSVAFTGGDPYLRTGTDVAVLFESSSPATLKTALSARHAAAVNQYKNCEAVKGEVVGVSYTGAVSPDRTVCSYMASVGDAVVVTNSLVQLERLANTADGNGKSLSSLPEYRFFRQRYAHADGNETAFLIVTDAAIRRWCSPKWRIATSRRTRAMAVMSEYQARHMHEIVRNRVGEPHTLMTHFYVPDLGRLELTSSDVASSTYGTLAFMTPIMELDLDRVTPAEADSYNRWRNGYENNWSQFFDPIAVRVSVKDDRLSADLTVMPLIEGSDYNEFIEIVKDAKIAPDAGDRHAGTLAHWAMAVDVNSSRMKWASNFASNMMPTLKTSPLGWMGESIAVYVEPDKFWKDLAAMEDDDDREEFVERNFHRLPVALHAEVSSGFKLTLFLTGLRAFVEQTAPGMVQWETQKHNDRSYVRISPTKEGRNQAEFLEQLAIYYAATPKAFVVTLNKDVLERALDRIEADGKAAEKSDSQSAETDKKDATAKTPDAKSHPWLGTSMALQVDRSMLDLIGEAGAENYRTAMQARAWANLPILNEWKRLYPDADPLELHERIWKIRLRCPGGGKFVWNDKLQSMESTVYGSPAAPKPGPNTPAAVEDAKFLNFGLTFEHKGLRAKVEIDRK